MCGVVGYIGDKKALPVILEGLKILEYRGYDSSGVATLEKSKLKMVKTIGKIKDLEEKLAKEKLNGSIGIGHTRWATHGKPSTINSHPHQDMSEKLVLIHNGIIENYQTLKTKLEAEGISFKSETDTEVLAQLIGFYYRQKEDMPLESAVKKALREVDGAYAIVVMSEKEPEKLVVAKKASPLCLGLGKDENYIASDALAFIKHTNKVIYLKDGEMGVVTKQKVTLFTLDNKMITPKIDKLSLDPMAIDKGEYPHYMLKEIYEQPRAIQDTIDGRISADNDQIIFKDLALSEEYFVGIKRIIIVGCGTSWHSGLVGKFFIEKFSRVPVEVDYAAEFRYRSPLVDESVLVILISQSGETADTIAAIGEAQANGAKVLSIVNVPGSTIDRDSDASIYTFAGREIGVASTKAFSTQLVVLLLFALYLGKVRSSLPEDRMKRCLENLRLVPYRIPMIFSQVDHIKALAKDFIKHHNALYLGRGVGYPIALEGALKLKEISYIHAEGYPAAEMKHGPIALIDEKMPTVVLAFKGRRYDKIMSNIMEIKARGGKIIAIASEGNTDITKKLKHVITIPDATETASAILSVIPLQLLAYYIAVEKGCPVDQPRNLAKSVTVE